MSRSQAYERAKTAKRRARKRINGGKITDAQLIQIKDFYNNTCLRCGRRPPEVRLTVDHVTPLTLGGEDTPQNAQVLCVSCNSKKGVTAQDFRNGKIYEHKE